jgi:hypothetical protein
MTGDLVMMNYYDPFQNICPNTVPVVQDFNTHIADDAADVASEYHVRIRVADVFTAFGGAAVPNPKVCDYTWFCTTGDIHANTVGYGVIAQMFNSFVKGD